MSITNDNSKDNSYDSDKYLSLNLTKMKKSLVNEATFRDSPRRVCYSDMSDTSSDDDMGAKKDMIQDLSKSKLETPPGVRSSQSVVEDASRMTGDSTTPSRENVKESNSCGKDGHIHVVGTTRRIAEKHFINKFPATCTDSANKKVSI